MVIALTVLHVLMCFAIIAMVLFLQSGKGADIGSAFGGAGSQAVFGSMGTPTVVGKITAVIAILFTITSFSLALLGGERTGSVVREPAPTTAPATPAPAAPGTPAPTAPPPATPATPAPGR
ncbi:MAG: preprotein translocase subunit SecG [Candidatus Rokuibacteriota bacterium]|nr:MAG: preprotein translocase subunit SecG [Candidatus Rokubacteria bacterium]